RFSGGAPDSQLAVPAPPRVPASAARSAAPGPRVSELSRGLEVAIERADERAAEAKRAAEKRRRTLAQVGEALIAAKRAAGRKPSTIEAYSYWLRLHIVDYFGPMPVGEITRED